MSGLATKRLSVAGATSRSLVERLLAVAEAGHGRAAALLLALSLACLLPGFATLQPMDRDEPRFAQATKQMLEAGDFVDIRFQDEVRYKKPIGIHWLQAASVTAAEALGVPAARRTIALYRVPSLLGALAAVLLTYWAGLAFGGRREAFLAAALVAASLLLSVEARLAKTDAMLLACCTAAFGALARAWLGRQAGGQPGRTVAVFWAAIAFGVLIKGPMILLFLGLPAALLSWRDRSAAWLRALRPGLGLLLVLVVVLPWFLAIAVKSGGEFYRLAVGDDLLGKVTTGQQQHGAPPGFYLVAFFATFWPGAVLAAMTVPLLWRERRQDWAIFIAAGTAPAWLLFEAFPTKLPHYVLPLYPLCAIAVAVALVRGFLGPHRPGARLAFAAMPLI
ncbi:MAG: glycosyltransferase family 39 protein, partial [Methylobacteriaceae bacterium]|nr:glycosyltransferase family 39 protein [Methylobacteriaceae bacterium]